METNMTDVADTAFLTPRRLRIVRTSTAMAWLCLSAAVLLPVGVAAYWAVSPVGALAGDARVPLSWLESFGPLQRMAGALASLVPVAVLAWGLMRLRGCFLGFARGALFDGESVRGFRDFALALTATALLGIPARTLVGLVLSWGAPEGQKQLAISLSSDMLLMLCVGGTMAVVGWVLGEAADLAEENASFI
jgi:hypothetical protein